MRHPVLASPRTTLLRATRYAPRFARRLALSLTLVAGLLVLVHSSAAADEEPNFETHVAPILQLRCGKCHGDEKLEAGFDVRRKFTLVAGGDSGAALVDGKPAESLLWQRIEKKEMPPPDEGQLDEAQMTLLRRWIESGAKTRQFPEPPLDEKDIPSRITAEDRGFWSFQPPQRRPLPAVRDAARARSPVDVWLLANLESKQLGFNADAGRREQLRRLTFDLWGLPPTWEQWESFRDDVEPDAYERLVDRLLASPRYGERWGRHWLDIAGYADSDGYLAADRLRPEAWRYRDYVIDAHNQDLPYDQFLQEQLAGDELSDWRSVDATPAGDASASVTVSVNDELSPESQRRLIATGFLRTASDPTYPGYTEPNEIHQVLSDTLQIVGSTCLGLTVQCARCHSHKFDPFSQRDYYSLQAVFLPALDPARWTPSEVRGMPLATERRAAQIRARNQQLDQSVAEHKKQLEEATQRFRQRQINEVIEQRNASSPLDEASRKQLADALAVAPEKRNEEQKKLVAESAPKAAYTEAQLTELYPEFRDLVAQKKAAIQADSSRKEPLPLVRGLADLDGPPASGRILRRGDPQKPGAVVEAGVPEVLVPTGFHLSPATTPKSSGRRLAFARWLTQPDHPLTARVAVNRIWQHHFGRPLVATPANFGRSGAKPTHPELLDWLATELPARAWSVKSLHRQLVTSTAFRQSAAFSDNQRRLDPDNSAYGAWTPRRHEGEVVRDTVLAVSGKLNLQKGGAPAPVHPQGDGSVITADDAQGNRRSVYLIVRRSQHLTMLDLFDTPQMEVNCPERNSSTVPLQALALLHGPFTEQNAQAFGDWIRAAAATPEARIDAALRRVLTRDPSDAERRRVAQFVQSLVDEATRDTAAPTDAQRAAAEQAAWRQLALVLLNENEFLYVD